MMVGCVVQVWLRSNAPNARDPFLIVETDFEDFAAFCEAWRILEEE